ncbi:DNA-binding transcriptional regulator LsrR, DeoR family [Cohaesibacter sp. ES.047]|uniref:sugar-binding transcriptional regulator n=1 Tax=Cohaesibacter sp. ES.047 TaxID=1798205 RepID=UPI000BB865FC|nr:sugar-binding transcriptional regulator [Cohaesibacter sp. ES.047]SNY89996.1 DNA-binding transcriptional regulator LsrR, DeoR family [Cohaesibacter sp. ES.047]
MVGRAEQDGEQSSLDLAARAAWLSFVGGLTQDQIARELGISRQRAQRLVARATSEGLIHVRIDHKIADCLELERALKQKFGLDHTWVSPSVGRASDAVNGLTRYAAPVVEALFETEQARCFAIGTGRTLRTTVQHMQQIDGSRHKLVSLIGNVAPDASATLYEAIFSLAEKTASKFYPMAAPMIAKTTEEREIYHSLPYVKLTRNIAESADMAIVGMGQMSETAPLYLDGFVTHEELTDLRRSGAAGEICGRVFDQNGKFLDHEYNERIVGTKLPINGTPVLCIAGGDNKLDALTGALSGQLLSSLVTDEHTARHLLTIR